eukprot:Tbor_TRINITY_DN5519_c0_g1::TRINITY_DN5519_c0_g1_i1::g.13480::m.13480
MKKIINTNYTGKRSYLMNNSNVSLRGHRLLMVPYLPHHVKQYHKWMTDEDLLRDTCSEPLSLEEEYSNQASWLTSTDKLTFIILAPSRLSNLLLYSGGDDQDEPTSSMVMIGDCNIFNVACSDEDEMEINVMIAESSFRGQGLAKEAISLMMCYCIKVLNMHRFVAKVINSNEASKNLFEKSSLGFKIQKVVKVFDETHYQRCFEGSDGDDLAELCGYQLNDYVDGSTSPGLPYLNVINHNP